MSTNRSLVFANQEVYHVYNRGVERRPVFTTQREHERMLTAVWFYRHATPGITLSHYLNLAEPERLAFQEKLVQKPLSVSLLAFCLMPNHFHLILRQEINGGISRFVANITNSYTKYFNLKRKRVGPLFQGTFKAVHVETEEQLLHLTRYVHLNPVSSFLVALNALESYPWSSYQEYLTPTQMKYGDLKAIRELVLIPLKKYQEFVHDQAGYAQKLAAIKHLTLEEEK